MTSNQLQLETIESVPFMENTFVANLEGRNDCLVVDAGLEPYKIIEYLETQGLTPAAILCTHGHADHIGGNGALKQRWPDCPIVVGKDEAPMLTDARLNLSGIFGTPITSPAADITVDEGDIYKAAGFELEVFKIPGHSMGHIVFVWHAQPSYVFGGDVLMQGSIGRTDFPGGSFEQLADGIHKKLFTLPDDTIILPGHGPTTTTGHEKLTNPFVGENAGYYDLR